MGTNWSSFFGTGSSSGGIGDMSNLFSDYSAIRNGSYKNLLKSYYNLGDDSGKKTGSTGSSSNITEKLIQERHNPVISKEAEAANSALTKGISNMKSSVSALQKSETYEDSSDGTSAKAKTVSAVKDFVTDYNNVVSNAKKSTNTAVTSNVASMMKATSQNRDALAEIGISVNSNGTISLDEKKLQSADISKVQNLFSSDNKLSYGSTVASRVTGAGVYGTSAGTEAKTTDSVSTKANTSSSAAVVKSTAKALASSDLYAKKKGADGKLTDEYDVDKIAETAKNFVQNYNDMFNAAKVSTNSGVTSNLSYINNTTKNQSEALSKIGINVNKNGTLSFDAEKFKNADMADVQKAFKNYGSSVATNASLVDYYMTTQANASNGYTSNAAYNVQSMTNYVTNA